MATDERGSSLSGGADIGIVAFQNLRRCATPPGLTIRGVACSTSRQVGSREGADQGRGIREDIMKRVDRRSALKIGFAAASTAVVKQAAAQNTDALTGKDTSPWPGVVVRTYGESPSLIPAFKTVSMRDIIMQPGSKPWVHQCLTRWCAISSK